MLSPSLSSSSPSNAGDGGADARKRVGSSANGIVIRRPTTFRVPLAMAVLAALLVANLLVLGVHVWRFLPPNVSPPSRLPWVVSSSLLSSSSLGTAASLGATPRDTNDDVVARGGNGDRGDRGRGGGSSSRRRRRFRDDRGQTFFKAEPRASSSSSLSFVRYDVVPDALDSQHRDGRGVYSVVHRLPSIPDRRRMVVVVDDADADRPDRRRGPEYVVPSDAVRNLTYFLESRMRPDEEDRPLYVYNPMVLPLDPRFLDSSILDDLRPSPTTMNDGGGGGHNFVDDGGMKNKDDEETPLAYVGVYRVSNFGNCHGAGRGVPENYRNYLGLALLDANLNIVQGKGGRYSDVVIDLNQHLFDVQWSPHKRGRRGEGASLKATKQYMQDCQLIAAPPVHATANAKADRLILICNKYAMQVRLERTTTGGGGPARGERYDTNGATMSFNNTYGSGLQLTALERPKVIMMEGKNLHYFRADASGGMAWEASGAGDGYLEIWPGGQHVSMRMDFANYNALIVKSSKPEPDASFATIDSVLPNRGDNGSDVGSSSLLTPRDSGSACCVSIRWQDGDNDDSLGGSGDIGAGMDGEERHLLLGFSHRKTRRGLGQASPQYNYVSRVYAFEPTPPFDIVARSGFFCLGFALRKRSNDALNRTYVTAAPERNHNGRDHSDDEAKESDNEQVWGAANDYRLKINGEVFNNCPAIHFVTGIADKMGDKEETVIISYGVNDCYPRMIEVSKKFLVSLLKQSPKE